MKEYIDRIDLHTYTEWCNGYENKSLIQVDDLLKKNKTGVICVIDSFNTSAFIEIYRAKKRLNLAPIKLIYGLEVTINFNGLKIHSILLAKNKKGLKKLYEIGKNKVESTSSNPYIDIEKIKDSRSDFILGLIDFKHDLGMDIKNENSNIFKKYYDYVEINQYLTKEEVLKIISVCKKLNKLVVATSYPEMLDKSKALSLRYLYLEKSPQQFCEESRYYWSKDDMKNYFSYVDNIEEIIIDNPKKIADEIEDIELENEKGFSSFEKKNSQFRKHILNEANKYYSNKIPKNIQEVLDNEIEYIEKHDLIDVIDMIESLLHYDKKYIGSTYLSGDLKDSLVLYLLGLTKEPTHYQITSLNGRHFIEFCVDELFVEDIKDEFIRMYEKNLCYHTCDKLMVPLRQNIKKMNSNLTEEEIEKIIKDTEELYCGEDEYISPYELVYLPENKKLKALFPFIKDDEFPLPIAKTDMRRYCNIFSFSTFDFHETEKNMKVKIIKGTNQIGGCITEIQSKEARIIVDFGEDLPQLENKDRHENPMIDGLTTGTKKYDAVFITHSHGDHIGLIDYILEDISVYVEKESKKIYELLNQFTYKKTRLKTKDMNFNEPITIKDMNITLFKIDHSSYNSGMLLIESGGKKILHTGDYRNHGRKGNLFQKTLQEIGEVDLLITEGTTFGRKLEKYKTEEELENIAIEEFKKYNQIFILQASTNIDRIVTFYKASKKTKKIFIEDIFTANITDILKSQIPTPKRFADVYAWIPLKYQKKSSRFKEKYFKPFEQKCDSKMVYKDFTMLVKTSMLQDLEMLKEKKAITNACLIYSMWEGYLEQESFKKFIDGVKNLGIDYKFIHTSGHGDNEARKLVEQLTKPKKVIPIHTENKEQAKAIFKNVVLLEDNEELEI